LSKQPLVLVVEDEYFLQADLEQILNDAGFASETVSSGEEALKLYESDSRKYDALITDVRMKGTLNGWDIAGHLKKEPALPVIYVTGSSAEDLASHGVPNSHSKPFARTQLISAASNLLNLKTSRTA
jgi:DNA-binding NtrC family response regulator